MKNKMKTKQNEGNFDAQFVCINGVSRFREHPQREMVWNYMGRAPISMCMVIELDDWVEMGYIDSIENEYLWPCSDTTCTICHPTRTTGKRRSGLW